MRRAITAKRQRPSTGAISPEMMQEPKPEVKVGPNWVDALALPPLRKGVTLEKHSFERFFEWTHLPKPLRQLRGFVLNALLRKRF